MKYPLTAVALILTLLFSVTTVSAVDPSILWLSSDAHIGYNGDQANYYTDWYEAVNDSNDNVTGQLTYALHLGDFMDGNFSGAERTHSFFNAFNMTECPINVSVGNHDSCWRYATNLSNSTSNAYGNYTYTIGNVLIIIISDERPYDSTQNCEYHNQTQWLNATVQANQDKNIFVMAHHGIYNTTNCTEMPNIEDGGGAVWHMNLTDSNELVWIMNHYNITAFFHGHNHLAQFHALTRDMSITKYGTFHANIGCIAKHGAYGAGNADSCFIYLENESSTATLAPRDHKNVSWWGDAFNVTFNLDFPFDPLGKSNSAPTIENPEPDNGNWSVNRTVNWSVDISDDNSTFSWTIECSSGNSSLGNNQVNGTKYLNMTGLNCSTNYTVWVNASDGTGATSNAVYYFNTRNCSTRIRIWYEVDINQEETTSTMFFLAGVMLLLSSIGLIVYVIKKGGIL